MTVDLYSEAQERKRQMRAGGSAFPSGEVEGWPGMTLRDWFAGMALQGLLAAAGAGGPEESGLAAEAYRVADAMLAERDK